MNKPLLLSAALAAAALGLASPAFASSGLPAQSVSTECVDNNNPVQTTGGVGVTQCSVPGAQTFVSVSPWVALEARIDDSGTFTQIVDSHLTYYFEVTGGTAGASVPIDITLNLLAQGPTGDAFASFASGPVGVNVCNTADCADSQFHGTFAYTAIVGQAESVQLSVTAEGIGLDSSAFASADPLIFVDPTFDPTGQYQILLSDGVDNGLPPTDGVPEPAGWALMLGGFGLAGAALRRRRDLAPV